MKIAIVRLSALGDIIQSAIVLQFIKQFRQDIEIHWFIDERFKEILENHPHIDKLYALPLKDKKFFSSLKIALEARKNRYDFVLDLQGLIKSAFVSRILSRNNFGFDKDSLKESFAHNFYNQKLSIDYAENVFVRYLALAAFTLNAPFEPKDIYFKQPIFKADEELKNSLKKRLNLSEKNILIHVGSSAQNKIYPMTKLAILCKLLLHYDEKLKIYLAWGNEKEKILAKRVLSLSKIDKESLILLDKLSLKELIALTQLSSLVIGNDSGPTHLAFAMNKPSITIFGATPHYRNAFVTDINKTISTHKKIANVKHIDKSDFCIRNIDEEDIFSLAKELLDER
ncbi:TPA: lipopolysaccharide heptosyltransferase I [Campylobacter upsaliensis]|nr:lipopolysaccharide heptosyltransferase I [Campylobacter upsaliensis]HEC1582855.1 lipopolysaccharide heptosyltransferase I [Campylobacter upsaliensis]